MNRSRNAMNHARPGPLGTALALSLVLSLSPGCSNEVGAIPTGSTGSNGTGGGSGGGSESSSVAQTGGGGVMGPSWPDAMDHRTEITFKGNEIECKLGVIPVPYQVPDCATTMTAPITTLESGDVCDACDRTYHGPFTYLEDTCSELAGNEEPATEGSFGFKFTSETTRELWGKNDQMVWEKSLDLVEDESGTWVGTVTDHLILDPPDCNNGEQNLGTFEITVFFTDVD